MLNKEKHNYIINREIKVDIKNQSINNIYIYIIL